MAVELEDGEIDRVIDVVRSYYRRS